MVLEDEALMEQLWASINYTLTRADTDSYLGPQLFKNPKSNDHRWP